MSVRSITSSCAISLCRQCFEEHEFFFASIIMVGDPKQLPATVLSQLGKEFLFEQR